MENYDKEVLREVSIFFKYSHEKMVQTGGKIDDDYNAGLLVNNNYRHFFIPKGLEYIIYELQISCLQDKKGDMMTVMEAIINLQLMRSMIKAYGEMGIENLRDIFINTQKTHEDVISIAALCFYTEEEFFLKPGLENNIDLAFNKAKGTACKIALALALDNFGKKDKLDKLRSKIDKFEWPLESFNRGNSLPFAHVLLDIASNGEVHRGKFFWKR